VLAIAGTGSVGQGTLATCDAVFDWDEVRVWSRSRASVDRFLASEAPKYPHLAITGSTELEQVVRGADVVVTGTHARGWIVDDAWIEPGTHIAALGADLAGEQELDPQILQRARILVDDIRQCRPDGEINVALSEDLITEDDVAGEIGKVICGELEGRQSAEQITVFDSTGIALQDSATVPLEYERALAAGVGIEKKMIST
jgi:alanine dehydrogenase